MKIFCVDKTVAVRSLFLFLIFIVITSQAISQTTLQKVVAKPGDGIYTLLRRHGISFSHLNSFLKLNKGNIGENNSLYAGRTYLLPTATAPEKTNEAAEVAPAETSSPTALKVPLFGKDHARVEIIDRQLKGAVFYLVGGHGGPDPGAVGTYGPYKLAEDEYAYDVTIRLAKRLMEHGATVYMIIQDENDGIRDETVLKMDRDEVNYSGKPISLSQVERLRQRTNAINSLYANHKGAYQRMLAIHVDSRSKGQNIDVFFYHHEKSSAGRQLAENIHQTFTAKYKRYQPNRDYFGSVSHRSSLFVVKYTYPPTVFIELGNIRNNLDQRRFVIPNNRQALANWICEGIITDYKGDK
ncbi:N-acetylmuramoyl-L-alanine amidase family protein [Pontibacter sp. MBLB2868]|uniref:N-acetylmuramoyl-L-alanine amidase family protein n=1 Tax=Pontibacter sp. MBLB2868 TaxID=3451555 RepID=UPI003F75043F